jgi:hypothetical protein
MRRATEGRTRGRGDVAAEETPMQSGGHLSSNPPLHRLSTLRAKNVLDSADPIGTGGLGKRNACSI